MSRKWKAAAAIILAGCLAGCAHQPPPAPAARPFRFPADSFAFANETVWNYVDGRPQPTGRFDEATGSPEARDKYSRRCFVMSRAAVQFWKFARFQPAGAVPSDAELARRIRLVCAMDVWKHPLPPGRRVAFPGFRSLHDFSRRRPELLRDNIGAGWPTYFRSGNLAITFPPSDEAQARTFAEISSDLRLGYPTILWLINFPSLSINHAVVVYGSRPGPRGRRLLSVYDPNLPDKRMTLTYDPATRTFEYPPSFYFMGGEVRARPVYRSTLQ